MVSMNGHDQLKTGLPVVRRRPEGVAATVTNDAGTVTATVDAGGHVRELVLDQRIYRETNPEALARDILCAVRVAAAEAADKAFTLTIEALEQGYA
jgi:DNA-binding protein YbaB